MNGEVKSNQVSLKEQLANLDQILDEYEKSHGFTIRNENNIEKYLNLSIDELRKMTNSEIGEAAYSLSRYSVYIQKQHNIETVRMNWAEHRIKKIISKELIQYKNVYSYEERKQLAIANNDVAVKLDDIRNYAKARSDRIAFISSKINEMAKYLIELQKARRSYEQIAG